MEKVIITIEVTYTDDSPDHSSLLDSVQDNIAELLNPYDDSPFDEEDGLLVSVGYADEDEDKAAS